MTKLTLSIPVPIGSASVVDNNDNSASQQEQLEILKTELEDQKHQYSQAIDVLNKATEQVASLQDHLILAEKNELIRLALAIAERVIHNEIQAGNYQIDKIIDEALAAAPAQQNVVIRLHPGDKELFQNQLLENQNTQKNHLELIADPSISPGECCIETDKGMSEYRMHQVIRHIQELLASRSQT